MLNYCVRCEIDLDAKHEDQFHAPPSRCTAVLQLVMRAAPLQPSPPYSPSSDNALYIQALLAC